MYQGNTDAVYLSVAIILHTYNYTLIDDQRVIPRERPFQSNIGRLLQILFHERSDRNFVGE